MLIFLYIYSIKYSKLSHHRLSIPSPPSSTHTTTIIKPASINLINTHSSKPSKPTDKNHQNPLIKITKPTNQNHQTKKKDRREITAIWWTREIHQTTRNPNRWEMGWLDGQRSERNPLIKTIKQREIQRQDGLMNQREIQKQQEPTAIWSNKERLWSDDLIRRSTAWFACWSQPASSVRRGSYVLLF